MPSEETRRRLMIGEAVAVAGLIVAALSLYLAWSGRSEDKAEHDAQQAESRRTEAVQRSRIGLVATDADGEVLSFKGVACALQSADISFPEALDVPPQNTALASRIEADWFDEQLLEVLRPAKVDQGRLPVLIESRCTGEDGDRRERAIYEIPFRIDGSLLGGKTVHLRGLVLREHVGEGQGQARLNAAWKALAPSAPGTS